MTDLTQILERVDQGDSKAADQLLPLVYEELRKLAAHKMANEAASQTLQPTALVHEAWLRLGPFGTNVFQVCPDCGSTWVKPVRGGLGMRMR